MEVTCRKKHQETASTLSGGTPAAKRKNNTPIYKGVFFTPPLESTFPPKGISYSLAMALPPGFLDELRARTPLPGLIGRKTRLLKSGRNWKGCCPFHEEKTPSFYVYDDHFHCFGCGAHGDAVTFVMRADGAQFMEAVERLAGLLGRIGSLNNSGERLCRTSFVSR